MKSGTRLLLSTTAKAEFRSDPQGLKVGVGIAALLGFVFMAPGAVMVAGRLLGDKMDT